MKINDIWQNDLHFAFCSINSKTIYIKPIVVQESNLHNIQKTKKQDGNDKNFHKSSKRQ